ncbi:MAG: phosphopantetheine adenylyltransferase [Pseudomonadales bacterium]
MRKSISFCLVVVGLINLAPVMGVVSVHKLEMAYSVSIAGNDLAILMRHRALLFGILGAFIIYSAFSPHYQSAAIIMGGVSMVGFVWLVVRTGGYNDAIAKVLFIDVLGLIFLLAAVVLKYTSRMR